MNKLTMLVAVATYTVCGFTVANADTTSDPPTVTVRYADLNTTNASGAAVLYRRLRSAADRVCQDLDPGINLALVQRHNACVNRAVSNAVAKVDRPAVSAYAAARGIEPAAVKIAENK